MILLYAGSGSWEIQLLGKTLPDEEWLKKKRLAQQLLSARKRAGSALLDRLPWVMHNGTNYFGDEFVLLYAKLPIDAYVEAAELEHNTDARAAARSIVGAFEELGIPIRFLAFEPDTETDIEAVAAPALKNDATTVSRALNDADHLLHAGGAISAVDRVHTAMHGYMRQLCEERHVELSSTDSLTVLWKKLRTSNASLHGGSVHVDHVSRIAQAMATVLDALGTVRNNASVAHANQELLTEAEAMLAVNAARTLLHYLDATFGSR